MLSDELLRLLAVSFLMVYQNLAERLILLRYGDHR